MREYSLVKDDTNLQGRVGKNSLSNISICVYPKERDLEWLDMTDNYVDRKGVVFGCVAEFSVDLQRFYSINKRALYE
jgi:hypothetical protein